MQPQGTATARDGLIIASGYGLKINVQRGHLVVHDGAGTRRQTRRFSRATSGLRRLVVLGHDGYISLDALHWLREVGCVFVQLDHYGRPIAQSSLRGSEISRLRRSQAYAAATSVGTELTRFLLTEKVEGQAALAKEISGQHDDDIASALDGIAEAGTIEALVAYEAAAASAYWRLWSGVEVPFPPATHTRLPAHWLTFGQRHSPLSRSPRLAANPANAILNYLYALLETETTIALQTIGLDPGLGVFHSDKPGRASMSLDVMEACRPVVDAYLRALLTDRALSVRDFVETPRGACRLRPACARQLAETTTVWGDHISPIAERVAQLLAHAVDEPLPTKLTHSEHVEAWAGQGTRGPRKASKPARIPQRCKDCGAQLPNQRHRCCENCREERWGKAGKVGRQTAASVLRQLRAEGLDPAHGGRAGQVRGKKNAAHQAAVREWNEREGEPPDPRYFADIAAGLRRVPIATLEGATGLSGHYCSLIRLGKRTPHPRHWSALRRVADDTR